MEQVQFIEGNVMQTHTEKHMLRRLARTMPVALALGGCAMALQALAVQAPPLPPGSSLVRAEPGLSPEEIKRHKRAHAHSKLEKKDPTRDDSVDTPADPKDPKAPKDPKDPKDPKVK